MTRRGRGALAALFVLAPFTVTGCAEPDDGILRQITPGSIVFIQGEDPNGDEGDRALVEQKPSGLWVVPMEAPFRYQRGGTFQVEVALNDQGQFVVRSMGDDPVGRDHDNCLATDEVYAVMGVPTESLNWEPEVGEADTSNDDCERVPEQE